MIKLGRFRDPFLIFTGKGGGEEKSLKNRTA